MVIVLFVSIMDGYRKGIEETQIVLDRLLLEKSRLLTPNSGGGAVELVGSHQWFQVFDSRGRLLRRSSRAPSNPYIEGDAGFSELSHDGERWRVYREFHAMSGLTSVVAERATDRFAIAEAVVQRTLVPILIGVPILGVLMWVAVTFGLRHVKKIQAELARRSSSNLKPLSTAQAPQELLPMLQAMNRMLVQIENSFDREKRFSSDAAHELRTPLSALKIHLYNLTRKFSPEDEDVRALEDSLKRMEHLIDQLLRLYRTSSVALRNQFESVDLARICRDVIAELWPVIDKRGQEIELSGDSANLMGNSFALSALVQNLVDNASKYTHSGGHIAVSLVEQTESILLQVDDNGPGIPASEREQVMARFYRVMSNSSDVAGCGLGLSIVAHVVALHGGTIELTDRDSGPGLSVVVRLPRQPQELVA